MKDMFEMEGGDKTGKMYGETGKPCRQRESRNASKGMRKTDSERVWSF